MQTRLAAEYGKPGVGGSDAHKTDCIGTGYTIFPEMVTCETELINLIRERRRGAGRRCSVWQNYQGENGSISQDTGRSVLVL